MSLCFSDYSDDLSNDERHFLPDESGILSSNRKARSEHAGESQRVRYNTLKSYSSLYLNRSCAPAVDLMDRSN